MMNNFLSKISIKKIKKVLSMIKDALDIGKISLLVWML